MKTRLGLLLLVLFTSGLALGAPGTLGADAQKTDTGSVTEASPARKLVVLWTSGDREVALKMVFMYTLNAKLNKWWTDITFIIWGPSSKLLSSDAELQEEIKKMKEAGVVLEACKACADQYGVSRKLQELGVDVKYMGQPLTRYIKEGRHVLTF
ncbi:MAG: DsrE family protein [Candidatus Aminicenantes bacterium]|jgi:hypothetical protein|nr:DsrE family protein [Candidatus Aminicenantes bacterium]